MGPCVCGKRCECVASSGQAVCACVCVCKWCVCEMGKAVCMWASSVCVLSAPSTRIYRVLSTMAHNPSVLLGAPRCTSVRARCTSVHLGADTHHGGLGAASVHSVHSVQPRCTRCSLGAQRLGAGLVRARCGLGAGSVRARCSSVASVCTEARAQAWGGVRAHPCSRTRSRPRLFTSVFS